ncbi:MAG: alpha-glucan family phosphorylase [Candidatus Hadarchaeales archaeon]
MGKIKVAYLSMEIGIDPSIHTYAGGLGILAGDTLKTLSERGIPAVGLTLLYRKGYLKQRLVERKELQEEDPWDTSQLRELKPRISVSIGGKEVRVRAFEKDLSGRATVPVIFLDTSLDENPEEFRDLTDYLYGGVKYPDDRRYRLMQEVVLGMGGVRMLEALGYEPEKYHLNESHTALACLELLSKLGEVEKVRERCIFTSHTPLPTGHEQFPYQLAEEVLGKLPQQVKELAGRENLNLTKLALSLSGFTNAVSRRHRETMEQMFPEHRIEAITNGVHSLTWTSESFKKLFDRYLPGWRDDPFRLKHATMIPDEEIWRAHETEKRKLLEFIERKTGVKLHLGIFTLGFARRMTVYKRPLLIFRNIPELLKVGSGKLQLVFGGKAYPTDKEGRESIRKILGLAGKLWGKIGVVYLENYGMEEARYLTAGVDLWLSLPERPLEACGTSGMKAAHNGIPQLGIPDGWWAEGCIEGVTGWSVGEEKVRKMQDAQDAKALYSKLRIIIPTFYNRRKWVWIMKQTIAHTASYYNTHRMVQEYYSGPVSEGSLQSYK